MYIITIIKKNASMFFLFISVSTAIAVFLKNAWVTEDAYIIFRSIEQLFAGNGPVWNPHERVQAFTSPLWYYILAFARIFSSDVWLNVIIVSFVLYLCTIFILKRIFNSNFILLMSILLFVSSTAFHDYTSSGLENVLAYFFISVYILNYLKLLALNDGAVNYIAELKFSIKIILFLFGLIACVRHDLILLVLPATIYVVFKNSRIFSIKQWIVISIIAFSPIILYSLFSVIYYGFPFPNTAYAKLNTGIDKIELLKQGIKYFYSSFKYDTITLSVIITGLMFSFYRCSEKNLKYLGYGVILNLFYVCYIGGDFMQGRFLSYAYMVSVILLLLKFTGVHSHKFKLLSLVGVCSYMTFYSHTPFNSPLDYFNARVEMGIADERGYYFHKSSLYNYITQDKENIIFPAIARSIKGYKFKKLADKIAVSGNIGFFGYFSGTEKIIIDFLGLSDPLLARMHARKKSRIGHFWRNIPAGYIESILKDTEVMVTPGINKYYKKLKIITQSEKLFTLERLKTIMLFNIGAYDHLLPAEYKIGQLTPKPTPTLPPAAPGEVLVQGGCYQMGSLLSETGRDDSERRHRICVADFYLGKHEVTRGKFATFVQATGYVSSADKKGTWKDGCWWWTGTGWGKNADKHWRNPGFSQSDNHPAVCVSWIDAVEYARWLSKKSGLKYRLPTEAEWEYAARGKSQTAFYWGDDTAYRQICAYANVADREANKRYPDWAMAACNDGYAHTAPVGSFKPNSLGLYDMSGNVSEYTCSRYDSEYSGNERRCAQLPLGEKNIVLRGGAWSSAPEGARSADRYWSGAIWPENSFGFRLARTP